MSKDFSAVKADFIQFVLNELTEETNKGFYLLYNGIFEAIGKHKELSYDNQARMIQNFTLLFTSWTCFKQYLFDEKCKLYKEADIEFSNLIFELFWENFHRVSDKKFYIKFATSLWEYSASRKYTFIPIENWVEKTQNIIGCYQNLLMILEKLLQQLFVLI